MLCLVSFSVLKWVSQRNTLELEMLDGDSDVQYVLSSFVVIPPCAGSYDQGKRP